MSGALESRYVACRAKLEKRGQAHVLRAWAKLSPASRAALLDEIEAIPWRQLDTLVESHVRAVPEESVPTKLEPAVAFPRRPEPEQEALYREAIEQGCALLAAGKVAAFTVAGGQGSRLGFDGPKGALPVSPVREKTLFQLFAEMVLAVRQRYGAAIPWYVMTNPANHTATTDFLREHAWFGLPESDVILFAQDMLPAFDAEGRVLMAAEDRIALAPSGHGGSLTSLASSGALRDMISRGIEIISYFQVDNPLVMPFDPLFIGLHRLESSEMSSKVTAKTDDHEKVGNLCSVDGRVAVIEYSDFPDALATARTPDGARKFDLGNLAIHLLDVSFVDRIVSSSFEMPFHRAEKKVAFVDETGVLQTPTAPNAVKLEAFIFDALPLAENPLLLTIDRDEEFSPVKNAQGTDSLETSHRDQLLRAGRWLEAAGIEVPASAAGEPEVRVEIASSFALDAADVRERVAEVPRLASGDEIYLE